VPDNGGVTETRTESRAAKAIREIFKSERPLIYVRTPEELRVARVLREVSAGRGVWTWTLTEGLRRDNEPAEPGTDNPRAALDFIAEYKDAAVFHLKDFHEPLRESAAVRRRLRDLYESCKGRRKYVVISSPVRTLPEEVQRSVVFLDLWPPDATELVEFLRDESGESNAELLRQMAGALQGLTLDEAGHALKRALAEGAPLGLNSLPALLEEKRLLINRSGVIECITAETQLDEVGGLDGLKKWLTERKKLFLLGDAVSAEIVPKGVLFMGIPGCGKSLCVKAIASYFRLPLYRVDMSAIFSGRYGKPEGVFVEACRMMEEMAPAVLWFDEIEMGITSTESGGEQGRIFAFFLTWMQEKVRGLFVAATANRIDLLPAEMIRKGRFDEVFFVDLPSEEERIEVFKIHLSRRGVDPKGMNLEQLMEFTKEWTGAEIEQCVISAITKAKLAEREITPHDLIGVAVQTVPLSRTMHEQINHIRGWAFERAVRASPKALGR
jgi:SpoVK/Ycf46/Vps4 family AAA+-type ATPase